MNKAIKSIFPESNAPPVLVIKSNCHIYQGKYLSCTNDTVIFDLSNSRDEDTPRDELTYFTRQTDTNGLMNPSNDLAFSYDPYAHRQVFIPTKPGLYAFLFYVSDGISTSEPQIVFLNIIQKPKLALSNHYFLSNKVRWANDYYNNTDIGSGWVRVLKSNSKPNEWELIVKPIDPDTSNSSGFGGKYVLSRLPEIEISDDSAAHIDSLYQYFLDCNNLHIDAEPQNQSIKFNLTGRAVPGRRKYNLIARHKTQNIYTESEQFIVDMRDRYYPAVYLGISYSNIKYDENLDSCGSLQYYKNYLQLNMAICFYKIFFTEISLCLDNYNKASNSSEINPIILNVGYIKPVFNNFWKYYLSTMMLTNNYHSYYFLGWGIQYNLPLFKTIDFNIGFKSWLLSLNKNNNIAPSWYSINVGIEFFAYPFGPF
jgi:hypothetical protein